MSEFIASGRVDSAPDIRLIYNTGTGKKSARTVMVFRSLEAGADNDDRC
ncbi:MAG: hypothetical protein MZV63_24600 [Marinilabiliales bacterium]|nr:hypothetical protein [Marinilabiliales bacterium]